MCVGGSVTKSVNEEQCRGAESQSVNVRRGFASRELWWPSHGSGWPFSKSFHPEDISLLLGRRPRGRSNTEAVLTGAGGNGTGCLSIRSESTQETKEEKRARDSRQKLQSEGSHRGF